MSTFEQASFIALDIASIVYYLSTSSFFFAFLYSSTLF